MFYEKAVFRLNPSIVTITDGVGYNSAGEVVTFDQAAAETEAERDKVTWLRAGAYSDESDPLFFKAQRGEATTDEWTAKVAEIKARFPYPGGEE